MKQYLCQICNKEFQNSSRLKQHIGGHTKPYTCPNCDKSFTRQESLKAHMTSVHNADTPHICVICEKEFPNPARLKQHMGGHTRHFQCPDCGKRFTRQETLNTHVASVHNDEKPHSCEICEREFPTHARLRQHLWGHTKPFVCSNCDKRFSRQESLNAHMIGVHNTEDSYICVICARTFPIPQRLKHHMATHYRDYSCPRCDKSFSQERQLNMHMEVCTDQDEDAVFECSDCGKNFVREKSFKMHVTKVHGSAQSENLLSCPECDMSFAQKEGLGMHLADVHGKCEVTITLYQCTDCGKTFSSELGLEKHIAELHEAQTSEEVFICYVCKESFKEEKAMKAHLPTCTGRKGVSSKKNISCPNCCKEFAEQDHLDIHIATVHKDEMLFLGM